MKTLAQQALELSERATMPALIFMEIGYGHDKET